MRDYLLAIGFSGDPQPPPATLTMVAGGGALVVSVEMLFRSCAVGLRWLLSQKLEKSRNAIYISRILFPVSVVSL